MQLLKTLKLGFSFLALGLKENLKIIVVLMEHYVVVEICLVGETSSNTDRGPQARGQYYSMFLPPNKSLLPHTVIILYHD